MQNLYYFCDAQSNTECGTQVVTGANQINISGFDLFLNPAEDELTLRFLRQFDSDCSVTVTDVSGRKVKHQDVEAGADELHINLAELSL